MCTRLRGKYEYAYVQKDTGTVTDTYRRKDGHISSALVSCDDGYEVLGDASLLCDRGEYQFMTSFLRADFVRAVVRGERNVTTADPPAVWRYGGDSMQRRL